jgi:hypothetical protein
VRGQLRLVNGCQLGVHPRRASKVGLAGGVARVEELTIERLEVLPPHDVAIVEAKLGSTVANPCPSGFAALFHCRQVVARPALAGDDRAVGGADRLERVRGVVPARDADDDCHDRLLSVVSTIFDLELS